MAESDWRDIRRVSWRYWALGAVLATLALLAVFIKLEWPARLWLRDGAEGELHTWAEWLGQGSSLAAVATVFTATVKTGLDRVRREDEVTQLKAEAVEREHLLEREAKERAAFLQSLRRLQEFSATVFASVAERHSGDDLWRHMTVRFYTVDHSKSPAVLHMVAETRHHPRSQTRIGWTEGVGTVGLAWRDRRFKWLNLRSNERLDALDTEEKWNTAPEEIRQNLSFRQAHELQDQGYGAVTAYPVADGETVIGVVSFDVPGGFVSFIKAPELVRLCARLILLAKDDFRKVGAGTDSSTLAPEEDAA